MDGGIEQNPAYGAALTFDLQQKCGALLLATEVLTPCSTPTGLARISFGGWRHHQTAFGSCPHGRCYNPR
jgi:hypothetical protein